MSNEAVISLSARAGTSREELAVRHAVRELDGRVAPASADTKSTH